MVLWMEVGLRIESELRVWVSHGDTPRAANVVVGEAVAVEFDGIPELPLLGWVCLVCLRPIRDIPGLLSSVTIGYTASSASLTSDEEAEISLLESTSFETRRRFCGRSITH